MLGACLSTQRMCQSGKISCGFHNRGVVWDTPMSNLAGEGENIWCKRCRCPSHLPFSQEGRGECCPLEDDKTAYETSAEKRRRGTQHKTLEELDPMVLDAPGKAGALEIPESRRTVSPVETMTCGQERVRRGSRKQQQRILSQQWHFKRCLCNIGSATRSWEQAHSTTTTKKTRQTAQVPPGARQVRRTVRCWFPVCTRCSTVCASKSRSLTKNSTTNCALDHDKLFLSITCSVHVDHHFEIQDHMKAAGKSEDTLSLRPLRLLLAQ